MSTANERGRARRTHPSGRAEAHFEKAEVPTIIGRVSSISISRNALPRKASKRGEGAGQSAVAIASSTDTRTLIGGHENSFAEQSPSTSRRCFCPERDTPS